MILKHFYGSEINGYLNFDVDFFSDLTFLTGINGTGKTSALNSIAALLMPRIDFMATQSFNEISITVEENGETVILKAEQSITDTTLSCSLYPKETLIFEPFGDADIYSPGRAQEMERDYYKELVEDNSKHPVISFIQDLPTPMFLGLDRRSRSMDLDPRMINPYSRTRRAVPRKRNIFGSSLSGSLNEAMHFAERRIAENLRRKSTLDRKFRDTLVLELLNFPPIDFAGLLSADEVMDPTKLNKAKANIYKIPNLLGVSGDAMIERINELFEFIEDKMLTAQQPKQPEVEEEPWNDPIFEARLALAHNKSNIDKINALSEMVSKYTKDSEEIFFRVDEFVELINSFIRDSGKTLEYDETGDLRFRVAADPEGRDLRTLSSGEIQLIVIFAHLYFNPETEKANVFIIDEPELSLHVQWQEKFVNALMKASKSTQFVMATHSPTILMGRLANCKEIPPSI